MDESCPFCTSPMEAWQTIEHEAHVDKLLKCPKCGFIATFRTKKKSTKKVINHDKSETF